MTLLRDLRLIEDGIIIPASLLVENGVIEAVLPPEATVEGAEVQDCGGLYAAPGFIELHAHGASGSDVMDCTPASPLAIRSFTSLKASVLASSL